MLSDRIDLIVATLDNDEGSRESFLVIAPDRGRGGNNSGRYTVVGCE